MFDLVDLVVRGCFVVSVFAIVVHVARAVVLEVREVLAERAGAADGSSSSDARVGS